MLLAATILLLMTGIAHSYLGERYILIRLARRDNLPKVLGSATFTMATLRFVWHLTTVVWGALAFLLLTANSGTISREQVLTVIGVTSLISAVFPLYFTRGKHLSWIVFVVVGVIVLAARGNS